MFLIVNLDQVWSILPALELLSLDFSQGSNSDVDKMDRTWYIVDLM